MKKKYCNVHKLSKRASLILFSRDDDIEMYGRPKSPLPARMPPPPPYESRSGDSDDRHHYIKNREYDRRRDYERYRDRDRSPHQERKRRSRRWVVTFTLNDTLFFSVFMYIHFPHLHVSDYFWFARHNDQAI